MKVGKLKKQKDLLVNQVNQNITEDPVSRNPDKLNKKQKAKKKIEQASPETINELLQSLFAQVQGHAQYNQVADTSTYLSSDQNFSEEEIQALKFDNRKRAKALAEDLDKVSKQVERKLEAVNYQYEYDSDIPELSLTATLLFGKAIDPNADNILNDAFGSTEAGAGAPGRLTQKQVDELDRIIERFAAMKGDQQVAKFNKKSNNKKKAEDLDAKYDLLISQAISYEVGKLALAPMVLGHSLTPNPKLTLATNPLVWPPWPNKLGVIEDFDLHKDASALHQSIRDNKASLPEEFHPDVFLIPLREQIKTLTQTTSSMAKTLASVDDQNSFVDRIFSGKEPIKIRKPGGIEESFDMDRLADCWDCFASKWKDPEFKQDFEADFKIEFKFNKLIANLESKWDKMKAALDVPYIVQQNYCSLMRLGSLCPTEILMLLAALTGMAIFTWEELFSSFSFGGLGASVSGFLGLLFFNGFLKPILEALDLTGKFSVGPINFYAGCTVNSLVKLQDIDKYSGQYGIKTEEALGWFSNAFVDQRYTQDDAIGLVKKLPAYIESQTPPPREPDTFSRVELALKGSDVDEVRPGIKDKIRKTMARCTEAMASPPDNAAEAIGAARAPVSTPKIPEQGNSGTTERWPKQNSSDKFFVEEPPAEKKLAESKAMLEDAAAGKERFANTLLNPLLQTGGLDVLEVFSGLLKDFAEKIKSQEGIISTALQGIDELFSGDSFSATTALIAKLAGIGHLLAMVHSLVLLSENGIEPCLKMPIETPDGVIYTVESPFTEEELRQMTGNKEKVYYSPSVIVKPNGTGVEDGAQPYVYNPITDRRFNLTNCNAAKSSIISRGESLEFWKRVSLGKDVDNV
jgi:hypothetical protein